MVRGPKQHHSHTRFSPHTGFLVSIQQTIITSPEEANCTLFSSMSRERTYRCLVNVVHVGGSSAACPDGVLAQRKEVLSSSGQDAGLILGGFYSRSPELLWSLPRRTGLPPQACASASVSVYVCHLANLSQSPGSDKNAAALRGHSLEWNEQGRGARVVLISREGGRLKRHSTFLQTWTRDGEGSRGCVCCVCV